MDKATESLREDGDVTQGPTTRTLLARLDIVVTELEQEQRRSLEIARNAQDHANALGVRKAELMAIRAELRPILDSSAPREFPYDKR